MSELSRGLARGRIDQGFFGVFRRELEAKLWALVFLVLCLFQTWINYDLGRRSKVVPYLVHTDPWGRTGIAGGAAGELTVEAGHGESLCRGTIPEVIQRLRTVMPDEYGLKSNIAWAYSFLGAEGRAFVDSYLAEDDPRLLSKRFRRVVSVLELLRLPESEKSYRAVWTEAYYSLRDGGRGDRELWSAVVTCSVDPPNAREMRTEMVNPFGVKLDLQWSPSTVDQEGEK